MSAYKRADEWGEQWRYRKVVTLPNGTKTRIAGTPAVNTKKAAEEAERAHAERVLNPPVVVVEVERHRMSDVFDKFMELHTTNANNKESERTSKESAISRHLRPALGKLYLDEVTPARLEELAAKLHGTAHAFDPDKKLGAKTVKNILQTLRKCLRWAEAKMGWLPKGAAPTVEMPKIDDAEMVFLEDAELDALLKTAAPEPIWYAAIVLASDAGLRRGELRALRWTDINEVSNKVVIARSLWRNIESSPKSRKPRAMAMTKRLGAALHAIRESKLRGPYVLSKADGTPFGAEYMHEVISRLARVSKVQSGWHTLRHTFCTRLAMRGVPPKIIQELAGHASLQTTMRYMHVAKGATDDAIASLDENPGTEVARNRRASVITP